MPLNKIRHHWAVASALAVSATSQIINSGINFLVLIYLVRVLAPDDFGIFNIAFVVAITISGIATSLFVVPMTVALSKFEEYERIGFMARMIFILLYVCTLVVTALISISIGAVSIGILSTDLVLITIATLFLAGTILQKEAVIQVCFNSHQEVHGLYINLISAATLLSAYLICEKINIEINAPIAITILALSQLFGLVHGLSRLITPFREAADKNWKLVATDIIVSGRWSALAMALFFLRTQSHTFIAGIMLGPAVVGAINAARIVFSPIQLVTPTIMRAAMPRLAMSRRTSPDRLFARCIKVASALFALTIAYSMFAYIFREYLFNWLVGDQYKINDYLMLAWASYMVVVSLRVGMELYPQVLGRFNILVPNNLASAILTIVFVWWFTESMGAAGSVIGLLLGETFAAIIIAVVISSKRRKWGET